MAALDIIPIPPHPWLRAEARLPAVEEALRATVDDEGPLAQAARHHLASPGKLARARLALASCEALGVSSTQALSLAVACELLHNASLVHDDIQDRDRERRGREAVWSRFGDATAVNLGDLLLTAAIHVAGSIEAPAEQRIALVEAFTGSTIAVIRGQAADTGERVTSIERYDAVARAKTGPLLALPIEGALILAGADESAILRARYAMEEVGTAFQIQDDLLDLLGGKQRRLYSDLRACRPSAPVLEYLATASAREREGILAIRAPSESQVRRLASRIRRSNAPERCRERSRRLVARAHRLAETLPAGLSDVVGFAVDRITARGATPQAAEPVSVPVRSVATAPIPIPVA